LLELNGDDLRKEPLEQRKSKLEKLLVKGAWGLRFVEHLEGDGAIIFQQPADWELSRSAKISVIALADQGAG
jgi:ATP-dependent DNA ligase